MNDDNELSDMRESLIAEGADLAGVHMDRPAEAVMARGQRLRLRRRLLRGLSGVTAASAALALALTLPGGGAGFRQVHVNEAAWSVNTNKDGTVTLLVRKAADPVRLETVLSQAGVTATVGWGRSCEVPVLTVPSKSVTYWYAQPKAAHGEGWVARGGWTVRFKPGQRLSKLVYFLGSRTTKAGHGAVWSIVVNVVPSAQHPTCVNHLHPVSGPHASPTGSPHPTATPRPHPSCSPRPTASPSPHGTLSPLAAPTARVHPAATASPSRTATPRPHPSCSPKPTASPSPTASPYSSPSPRLMPASSPTAG
jgi:hypothetical protein